MFVRGMYRGGLFVGMMQVETQHEGDATSISGELSGSYGFFSADVQAKFKETIERYNASVYCSMFHIGGPVNLHINDPSKPEELLQNANAFLDSFNSTPDAVAKPYSVTLAPISIASGPLPLNAAQIEQAQDVLAFCAKRRSALMDQQNLLQYIADNPSKFEFTGNVSIATIVKTASDTQDDLDLIAACASNAINDPANAVRPDMYAHQHNATFPKATMPDPLPTPKRTPGTVVIPSNWIGAFVMDVTVNPTRNDPVDFKSAADLGLRCEVETIPNVPGRGGDIASTAPPPGTEVPIGSVVKLIRVHDDD